MFQKTSFIDACKDDDSSRPRVPVEQCTLWRRHCCATDPSQPTFRGSFHSHLVGCRRMSSVCGLLSTRGNEFTGGNDCYGPPVFHRMKKEHRDALRICIDNGRIRWRTKRKPEAKGSRKYRKRRPRTAWREVHHASPSAFAAQSCEKAHPVASAPDLSLTTSWPLLQNRPIRHSLYQVRRDARAWVPREWLSVNTNCQ